MSAEHFRNVIVYLEDLREDEVPKSIREKINQILLILKSSDEPAICKNKALHELEEIADSVQMQPHARMQLFNIVSMLEGI